MDATKMKCYDCGEHKAYVCEYCVTKYVEQSIKDGKQYQTVTIRDILVNDMDMFDTWKEVKQKLKELERGE